MTNETITITVERPAYGGVCIGRLGGKPGGKVVMVKGAIPGETVEARIDEEKQGYLRATVTSVIEPSPDRVKPPCPYFGDCGGCQLQYAGYARQVKMKQAVLSDCMARIARMDVALSEPLTGPPWGYRIRGQFKLAKKLGGKPGGKPGCGMLGLYREKTRDVVDITRCPLMSEAVNLYLGRARGAVMGEDISELHITCPPGTPALPGGGALALARAGRGSRADAGMLARKLLDAGFSGVAFEQPGKKPASFGEARAELELDGLSYAVSPESFIQANWALNNELVKLVTGLLGPLPGRRVLDLYSGAGNFALPMARAGAEVVAVEEGPAAVSDGRRNARANGIEGCEFIRSTAEALRVSGRFDLLVTDPPRPGLTDAALTKALELGAERVAYVSCNPSTFARDVRKLAARYMVESVRLVDFFPQTFHVECLGILRLG